MSEDAAVRPNWARHLPNLLSGLRLVLAIAFPFAARGAQLPVVLAAAATDWLDGYFARKWRVQSTFGGLLDAVADKSFALSVILVLAFEGRIEWWQILLVLARDFVVAFVALYYAVRRQWAAFRQMPSRATGKIATVLVFAWFVTLVAPGTESWQMAVFVPTALASIAAAVDYLVKFGRALAEHPA